MKIRLDFTPRYYPRSFLTLLLLAFALVALPLVLSFVNAAVYLERLAGQSQSAVAQAAQAARNSRLLTEHVTALERIVRQYLVLGDAELLRAYQRLRVNFKATTSELSLLPLDEAQLRELNRTIDKEQELYERLHGPFSRPSDKAAVAERYVELNDYARNVLDISNELIDRELERMRQTGEQAQRTMWLQLLATIPIGVLIAIGVTLIIAKPIRQLDQAIRKLGAGELDGAIRVRGPADLEYLGDRLDWLRRRLIELEQQKQLFLRHVSHELKTPLTALREGSELLAEGVAGPLTEKQREIGAILKQKSIELQRMIEDLLNYHRAQQSVTRLEVGPVRLDRIVEQALSDHRFAADARGIRAELRLEPVAMQADGEKLRVVADNLISNAIKYSSDGGTFSLVLRRDATMATLDVSDAGPGIPPSDHARIFDWFVQGEQGHNGRVQGSGLGLAIAKEFVMAHRGRIDVVNDSPAGAHFRVALPLA